MKTQAGFTLTLGAFCGIITSRATNSKQNLPNLRTHLLSCYTSPLVRAYRVDSVELVAPQTTGKSSKGVFISPTNSKPSAACDRRPGSDQEKGIGSLMALDNLPQNAPSGQIESPKKIKAIETDYDGCKFRSRLEARFAVYFKTLGITYFYEHEGYDLGALGWYLPDFYLPHVDMWAEVKPTKFNPDELLKLEAMVIFTQKPALMLIGQPERHPYEAICLDKYCQPNGLYYCEFILSTYHYKKEARFYGDPYEGEINLPVFDDIKAGVTAAKSARFQPSQERYDDYNRAFPIAA